MHVDGVNSVVINRPVAFRGRRRVPVRAAAHPCTSEGDGTVMSIILLVIVLVLLLGGGGAFYGSRSGWGGPHYGGGLLGLILIILLILWLTGNLGGGQMMR